jgi:uncharacterized protein YidB (DUF937 family)
MMINSDTSFEGNDRRLVIAVIEMLQGEGRKGIEDRLKKVDEKAARSWTSLDEQNCPTTGAMIEAMFAKGELEQLEKRSGMTSSIVVERLAALWPKILKRLAPLGKLPTDRILQIQAAELRRKLA